jgi:hypothetical protein
LISIPHSFKYTSFRLSNKAFLSTAVSNFFLFELLLGDKVLFPNSKLLFSELENVFLSDSTK